MWAFLFQKRVFQASAARASQFAQTPPSTRVSHSVRRPGVVHSTGALDGRSSAERKERSRWWNDFPQLSGFVGATVGACCIVGGNSKTHCMDPTPTTRDGEVPNDFDAAPSGGTASRNPRTAAPCETGPETTSSRRRTLVALDSFAAKKLRRALPRNITEDPLVLKPRENMSTGTDRRYAGWDEELLKTLRAQAPSRMGSHDEHEVHLNDRETSTVSTPDGGTDEAGPAEDDVAKWRHSFPTFVVTPRGVPTSGANQPVGRVSCRVVWDMPLPIVLEVHDQLQSVGQPHAQRETRYVTEEDVIAAVPRCIVLSQRVYVAFAFVEWVNRRLRHRRNIRQLKRDLVLFYTDALAAWEKEQARCTWDPEMLVCCTPSGHVLGKIADAVLECFVPALFAQHMRAVRRLDGAGVRLDAEFKMAKFIVQQSVNANGDLLIEHPFKCLLAARGVRGLYLDALHGEASAEAGIGYVKFLHPICVERKAVCAKDPEEGLFDFLVFDNGPAYELYALATVGAVWPKSIYGTPEPPSANIAEARHHASLRKDIVPVASDPPHRRWPFHKNLNNSHADFADFDAALKYALGRISAPTRLIPVHEHDLNVRQALPAAAGNLLQELCRGGPDTRLARLVQSTPPKVLEQTRGFLRSHDVVGHPAFDRLFGSAPPDWILRRWSKLVGVGVHPAADYFAYADENEFAAAIERVGAWFGVPRSAFPPSRLEKAEEPTVIPKGRRTGLLNTEQLGNVRNITVDPMRSSLLAWGDISRRWAEVGLRIPEATTTVEGGFHASHWELFLPQQKRISPIHFALQAKCTAMVLNYHLLHRHNLPPLAESDSKVLDLLDTVRQRTRDQVLKNGEDRHLAEAKFREFLKRQGEDVLEDAEQSPAKEAQMGADNP